MIPGSGKATIHRIAATEERLSEAVVDIYSVLKPKLAVMDGIVGMEGEGAINGDPVESKVILSGKDCVSLDAVTSEIMGISYSDILTTCIAHNRGLGQGHLDRIEVVGEKIDNTRSDFKRSKHIYYKLPGFVGKFLFRNAENFSKIEISKDECKKCNVCLDSCPVSAITLEPDPDIDRDKCIKCYCCHELCRNGAVKLKTSYIGRRLMRDFLYES